jgi:hypothetical protein
MNRYRVLIPGRVFVYLDGTQDAADARASQQRHRDPIHTAIRKIDRTRARKDESRQVANLLDDELDAIYIHLYDLTGATLGSGASLTIDELADLNSARACMRRIDKARGA